jgi:hypothetical protein
MATCVARRAAASRARLRAGGTARIVGRRQLTPLLARACCLSPRSIMDKIKSIEDEVRAQRRCGAPRRASCSGCSG